MRYMGVVIAGLMLAGGGVAFAADCSCHDPAVSTSHPVIAGSAERITAVLVTVTTRSGGAVTRTLSVSGTLNLGNVAKSDLVSVVFTVVANDPDDDVCEAGQNDAFAKMTGNLQVSVNSTPVPMAPATSTSWQATWVPSAAQNYNNITIQGTVSDKSDQHTQSDDPDLTVSGYKCRINVQNK